MRVFYTPEHYAYNRETGCFVLSGVLRTDANRQYICFDDKTRYIYDSHLAIVNGQFDARTDNEIITQVLFNKFISEGNTTMKVRPPDFTDLIKHRELNKNVLSQLNRDYVPTEGPKNAITIPAESQFEFQLNLNLADMYNLNINNRGNSPLKISDLGESMIAGSSNREIPYTFLNEYNHYLKFFKEKKLGIQPNSDARITNSDVNNTFMEFAEEGFLHNRDVMNNKIVEVENDIFQHLIDKNLDLGACSELIDHVIQTLAQNQCSNYLPGTLATLGKLASNPGVRCYLTIVFLSIIQQDYPILILKDIKRMIDKKIMRDLKINFINVFKKCSEFIMIKSSTISFHVPRINKATLNKLTLTKIGFLLFLAFNVIYIVFS